MITFISLFSYKIDLNNPYARLLEYEEIIQQKYGASTAHAFITLLKELPNVLHVEPQLTTISLDDFLQKL